ncbi:MAG TPA: hypothetical protein VEH82_00730 [Acidimicrobiales bacterium]|nr:hypothetical protein [Acidimicrobiales bacterium]
MGDQAVSSRLPARRPPGRSPAGARPARRRGRAAAASSWLLCLGLATAWALTPAPAVAAPSNGPLTVDLVPTAGTSVFTGKGVFAGQVLQYNLLVGNPTSNDLQDVVVTDGRPNVASQFLSSSPTCGTVPNCSVTFNATQVIYSISSVAAGASNLQLSFQVKIQPARDIYDAARWTGGGCNRVYCQTAKVVNPVLPAPVQLSSVPGNRAKVAVNQTITFTVTVLPYAYQPGDPDVVVTDPVPAGTTYVAGSATCAAVPGCTAAESNGVVTFTFTGASFAGGTNLNVTFQVVNNTPSGTIIDTATWTGGQCAIGPCNAQPQLGYDAVPGSSTSPSGPTTTVPKTVTASSTPSPSTPTSAAPSTLAYTGAGSGVRAILLLGVMLTGTAAVLLTAGQVPGILRRRRRLRVRSGDRVA